MSRLISAIAEHIDEPKDRADAERRAREIVGVVIDWLNEYGAERGLESRWPVHALENQLDPYLEE